MWEMSCFFLRAWHTRWNHWVRTVWEVFDLRSVTTYVLQSCPSCKPMFWNMREALDSGTSRTSYNWMLEKILMSKWPFAEWDIHSAISKSIVATPVCFDVRWMWFETLKRHTRCIRNNCVRIWFVIVILLTRNCNVPSASESFSVGLSQVGAQWHTPWMVVRDALNRNDLRTCLCCVTPNHWEKGNAMREASFAIHLNSPCVGMIC
jgi:hypothetical protein